jgi:hypothetical protein
MKSGIQRISVSTMMPVCDFLTKNKMAVFPYPPSSPDLATCDFLLLPELNTALKEKEVVISLFFKQNCETDFPSFKQ